MPVGAGTGLILAVDIPIWLLALFITVFNTGVCFVVLSKKKLRTYTNYLIASLAISDAITGAVFLPIYSLGPSILIGYAIAITLPCNIANVCAVTFDRYVAILQPLRYHVIIFKRFKPIIAFCWVVPFLLALFPLFYDSNGTLLIHRIYVITINLVMEIVLPYIFIFLTYFRIFVQIRKQSKTRLILTGGVEARTQAKRERKVKSEAQVAKLVAVNAIIFFLSWLPVIYMTVCVMVFNNPTVIPQYLPVISVFTAALGSLINPVLYALLKPDIRKEALFYLRSCKRFCCHSQSDNFVRGLPRVTFRRTTTNTEI